MFFDLIGTYEEILRKLIRCDDDLGHPITPTAGSGCAVELPHRGNGEDDDTIDTPLYTGRKK